MEETERGSPRINGRDILAPPANQQAQPLQTLKNKQSIQTSTKLFPSNTIYLTLALFPSTTENAHCSTAAVIGIH